MQTGFSVLVRAWGAKAVMQLSSSNVFPGIPFQGTGRLSGRNAKLPICDIYGAEDEGNSQLLEIRRRVDLLYFTPNGLSLFVVVDLDLRVRQPDLFAAAQFEARRDFKDGTYPPIV